MLNKFLKLLRGAVVKKSKKPSSLFSFRPELESFEERRRKFVYLWALIPLTRAIDTLVITIKDKNSDTYSYLRKTYEKFPDFVEWIE